MACISLWVRECINGQEYHSIQIMIPVKMFRFRITLCISSNHWLIVSTEFTNFKDTVDCKHGHSVVLLKKLLVQVYVRDCLQHTDYASITNKLISTGCLA